MYACVGGWVGGVVCVLCVCVFASNAVFSATPAIVFAYRVPRISSVSPSTSTCVCVCVCVCVCMCVCSVFSVRAMCVFVVLCVVAARGSVCLLSLPPSV